MASENYAHTVRGTIAYLYEQWKFQNNLIVRETDEFGLGQRSGRMGAYSDALQHLTGKRHPKYWEDAIKAMEAPQVFHPEPDGDQPRGGRETHNYCG